MKLEERLFYVVCRCSCLRGMDIVVERVAVVGAKEEREMGSKMADVGNRRQGGAAYHQPIFPVCWILWPSFVT